MYERVNKIYSPRLDEKRLLDINELCLYLSMGRTKAIYFAKENGFEVRIGARVLYHRKKVDKWCDAHAGADV